jgi:hypothetical protein
MGREREPEHPDVRELAEAREIFHKQLDGFDPPQVPTTGSLAGSEQAASEPPPDSND